VTISCKPTIHQYNLTLRQKRTVILDEGSAAEDSSIVIEAAEGSCMPDDKTERVRANEVVLCVEVLVLTVITPLFHHWHLNLAVGAIKNSHCFLTGREEAVKGLALFCIGPGHLSSPGIIHCVSDMISSAIRCHAADIVEEDTNNVGIIAVAVPDPQKKLVDRVEMTSTVAADRSFAAVIGATDVGFEFGVEEDEFGDGEASAALKSLLLPLKAKEGGGFRALRGQTSDDSVHLLLGRGSGDVGECEDTQLI
jgi:hypothetical protein